MATAIADFRMQGWKEEYKMLSDPVAACDAQKNTEIITTNNNVVIIAYLKWFWHQRGDIQVCIFFKQGVLGEIKAWDHRVNVLHKNGWSKQNKCNDKTDLVLYRLAHCNSAQNTIVALSWKFCRIAFTFRNATFVPEPSIVNTTAHVH